MDKVEVAFRRIRNAERMLDGVFRRRIERAVFAEFGVEPFWWPRNRG